MDNSANQPLQVKIENNQIVIRIGINTLCFAAEHCMNFWDCEKDSYTLKITNKRAFAEEVLLALEHEEEDGTTPVHVLFDDAFEAAVEEGCEGVDHEWDGKGATDER